MITPAQAIADPHLLGAAFQGASWDRWAVVLKAAYAEPLDDAELALFREVAKRDPPTRQVRELWIIAGRRAGKDSVAAAIATTVAIGDHQKNLRPGERAAVMCLAVDRSQSQIVKRYIGASFAAPLLMPLVERTSDDGLELTNGVEIIVATNSFRAVRGRTIICAIFDEVAFWRDENSTTPDVETYSAIVPGMATLPDAMLIAISTPYKRSGLLFEKWRAHFGKNDDDVLVIHAPSILLNPTLNQAMIDAAIERDPEAGAAEWLAEWRSDLADFVAREVVESCVASGVREIPPAGDVTYSAFVDPSGGSSDSMALAVGHRDRDGLAVLDAVRERRAPFSPESVVEEFAGVLASYRISTVRGDRYAGEWPRERFLVHGIQYEPAEMPKSEYYLAALPLLNSQRCRLLDLPRLTSQLCGLERRTARGGRNSVDHQVGGKDDVANAVCGLLVGLGGAGLTGWVQFYAREAATAEQRLGLQPREPASMPQQAEQKAERPLERGGTAQQRALPDGKPTADELRLVAPAPFWTGYLSAPDGHGRKFVAGADAIVVAPTAFRAALERAGCVALASMETGPAATPGCASVPPGGPPWHHTTPRPPAGAGGHPGGVSPSQGL